jgi:hypothetical protein
MVGLSGVRIPVRRYIAKPFRQVLGPKQPPVQWVRDCTGGKWPVIGLYHPSTSNAEFKERVEIILYPILFFHCTIRGDILQQQTYYGLW